MTSSLIALIDDDQEFRTTMARALEEEGFALITAPWHHDTFKSLSSAQPQLILLNIYDGAAADWPLAEELQTDPVTHRTPILVCCADLKQTQRAMVALLRHLGLVQGSSYNAKQLLDFTAAPWDSTTRARSVGE